jgi:hypothetical protein
MPYNLVAATPTAVLPQTLSTSFVGTRVYPLISATYNDGSFERSLIVDTVNPARALRTWILAKRLGYAQFQALLNFWEVTVQGGAHAFYFYDPTDVLAGAAIGSNYDPSGGNSQGRAVVFFRGNWGHAVEPGRGPAAPATSPAGAINISGLTLVEIA